MCARSKDHWTTQIILKDNVAVIVSIKVTWKSSVEWSFLTIGANGSESVMNIIHYEICYTEKILGMLQNIKVEPMAIIKSSG